MKMYLSSEQMGKSREFQGGSLVFMFKNSDFFPLSANILNF